MLSRKQSLSHCELITDEGIRQLALSPCAAEHLAVLELDNCPLITDASLDHLLQACHNLERIELYDCQLITRAGIRRLRVMSHYVVLNPSAFHSTRADPRSRLHSDDQFANTVWRRVSIFQFRVLSIGSSFPSLSNNQSTWQSFRNTL